jgi:hypothetical protein
MTKELTAFARVRYSTNPIGVLLNCLRRDNADGSVCNADCGEWNVTEREWRDALVDALEALAGSLSSHTMPARAS